VVLSSFWLDLTSLSITILDKSKWVCPVPHVWTSLYTIFRTTLSSSIAIFCANFNLISWILYTYLNLFLRLMTSHNFLLPSWLVELTHALLVSCILYLLSISVSNLHLSIFLRCLHHIDCTLYSSSISWPSSFFNLSSLHHLLIERFHGQSCTVFFTLGWSSIVLICISITDNNKSFHVFLSQS